MSLVVSQRGIKTIGEWHSIAVNVVKFFEGGVKYKEALNMPFAVLALLNREAAIIIEQTRQEMST